MLLRGRRRSRLVVGALSLVAAAIVAGGACACGASTARCAEMRISEQERMLDALEREEEF